LKPSEYIILLPNEKLKTYRYITLFILLINCLVFWFVLFNDSGEKIKSILLIGSCISLISFIFFLLSFFTKRLDAFRPEISFFILSICWLVLGNYFLAAGIFFFAVTGFYTAKKFRVVFNADQILYPSFPIKTYLWSEVSNVMLKDNVLTIDLKNNKLIQAVIEKESADAIDEKSFNEYCRQHMIATAETQRR
jgi:hypothetical protein